jgi:hypothetical protein
MTFTIEHSNGRKDAGYESVDDAIAQLRKDYDHIENLEIDSDADGTIARDADDDTDFDFLARIVDVAS